MDKKILTTVLLAIFIALLGVGIIAPIMPLYATDLGATGIGLGLMVASFSISRGVLQPFVGSLSDRQGRKRFLVSGLFIYTLAGLVYTLAGSVEDLILIRAFHGVGSAMIVPIAMAYIGELAPKGQESRYMAMLNIALFSGIGGGPVIGGCFLDAVGINWPFYAMALLSAASLLLVLVFLPARPPRSGAETTLPLFKTLCRMLRSVRITGILLSRMATMMIMIPSMAFLPILMNRFMEASGVEIGLVVASRTLTNASLQMPFGRLGDRHNKLLLLVTGSLVISGAIFVVPFASDFWDLMVLFAVTGVGEAIVWPTLGALAAQEGEYYGHGSIMGVFNMAMSAGVLLGSIAAGAVMDILGLSYTFFLVSATLVFATITAALMIQGRPPGPAVDSRDPAERKARWDRGLSRITDR